MALSHLIAHQIARASATDEARLTLRPDELPLDGKNDELMRELKHAYVGKAGKAYGQFADDYSSYPLSRWLDEYVSGRLGFAGFSEKAAQHLKIELEKTEVCLEGHLLFMQESLADGEFLYLFVVDHNEGVYIDGNLDMASSQYLNVSRVGLGAKVNITEWGREGGKHYLSVLRPRGDKKLTDLFWEFVGFTDRLDVAAETTEFLDIVAAYTQAMPEEEAQQTRVKVVDYCIDKDKSGEAVVMEDLSAHINEAAPAEFSGFIAQQQEVPKVELIPDRAQMRQFVRISGRNDSLSMSFAVDCLGEAITYDSASDSLIINNIPNALKSRLLQHLQKQGGEPVKS